MNGRKAKALRRAGVKPGPGIRRKGHEHPGDCPAVLRVWTDTEPRRPAESYDVRCRLVGAHDLHRSGQREWR